MNPEHVEIVKQGKEAIDQWRQANPVVILDLAGANLADTILASVDLSFANLHGANLNGANLWDADLSAADLSYARLSKAILTEANLSEANLSEADLRESDLTFAKMFHTDLTGTNLTEADLVGATLSGASLIGANLSNVDLVACTLNGASLKGAELTGARLYGTARENWHIEGIKCQFVFWDAFGKERSPRDRDLEPGEFELLYAQLPTIEYVFEHGMTPLDPLVMDRVVQAINEQNPEINLQIDSINARGIYPSITFNVQQEEQKATALEAVTQEYGIINAKLEGANEALSGVIDQMIKHGLGGPVNIGSNSMVAIGGSTINIQEYIGHLEEIEQAIKEAPPETLSETAKREALDTVSGAFKDVAKGKVKEVAEAVTKLGLQLGTHMATTAFQFFKDLPL